MNSDRPNVSEPSSVTWTDAGDHISAGTDDPLKAAWFLTGSAFVRSCRGVLAGPVLLGLIVAVLILAMVLLSPSTDSHFIYTDF